MLSNNIFNLSLINRLNEIKQKTDTTNIIPVFPYIIQSETEIKEIEKVEDNDFLDNQLTDKEEQRLLSTNENELISLILNSKINRKLEYIFWHCTASNQNASVSSIQAHWKKMGWKSPGYHVIVKPDGSWTYLLDFNNVSNGVQGYNSKSVHISYIGGIDKKGNPINNMTDEQRRIFFVFTLAMLQKNNKLIIKGHNEVAKKACPCFDVQQVVKNDLPKFKI